MGGGFVITPISQWIAAAVLLGLSALAWASDASTWSLKESTPGVVTATGPLPAGGTPRPQDFLLRLPDGRELPASEVVSTVGSAASPGPEIWLVLCIDHSGSMSASTREVKNALGQVVRAAFSQPGANLRIQTVAFGTGVQQADGFSHEPDQIVPWIDALPSERARDGKTRLYDAMTKALRSLQQAPGSAAKHLIVVSDGNDEGSATNAEAIEKDALAHKVPLDVIGYGPQAEASSPIMQSLAQVTHGEFILAQNSEELSQAIQSLFKKSGALPAAAPLVNVVFRYQPATNRPQVASASLLHAPDGQVPAQHELRLESAIAAPAAPPGPVSSMLVPAALAASALVILGGVFLLKRRRPATDTTRQEVSPPVVPPPVVPSPVAPAPANDAQRSRRRTVISPWFSPPSQGQPVAWLLCTNGKQQGYRYPIEQALVRIGAGAGNDIVLNDDEYISRTHASIRYDVSNLFLQDLHSGNGTFLNDERLVESAMPLAPGDRIRLGRTTLELQAS
jgi:hypothetical protein